MNLQNQPLTMTNMCVCNDDEDELTSRATKRNSPVIGTRAYSEL